MLLELYGVTGAERDGLIQLTREARQPGWWHSFRDVLPNPYEVYIRLEAGAASIRNFEPVVVPGLLQTANYAREIFRNGPMEMDHDEVSRRVEVRLARQQILAREECGPERASGSETRTPRLPGPACGHEPAKSNECSARSVPIHATPQRQGPRGCRRTHRTGKFDGR